MTESKAVERYVPPVNITINGGKGKSPVVLNLDMDSTYKELNRAVDGMGNENNVFGNLRYMPRGWTRKQLENAIDRRYGSPGDETPKYGDIKPLPGEAPVKILPAPIKALPYQEQKKGVEMVPTMAHK